MSDLLQNGDNPINELTRQIINTEKYKPNRKADLTDYLNSLQFSNVLCFKSMFVNQLLSICNLLFPQKCYKWLGSQAKPLKVFILQKHQQKSS